MVFIVDGNYGFIDFYITLLTVLIEANIKIGLFAKNVIQKILILQFFNSEI